MPQRPQHQHLPGFSPAPEIRAARRAETLGHVVRAAQDCLTAGTLVAPDAIHVARTCWVTMHGLCSLEVAGLLSVDDEDAFADALIHGIVDQVTPPGRPG
ncbi:MAG: Transcriptional regulator, TetR family [Frankiales bacterium]|nr:Transcriptional regulator, TetR family [Frankiales bacterium]